MQDANKVPPLRVMTNRKRLDLTEWVIHFVHNRKAENDPTCFMSDLAECQYWDEYEKFSGKIQTERHNNGETPLDDETLYEMFCDSEKEAPELSEIPDMDSRYPDYYNEQGEGVNILTKYEEEEYQLEEDADAFQVLLKILHDGYIHSSWSIRNMDPSIYGPKSAVCFTEMPLYALVDYAKTRGISGYVSGYGIALRRNELFDAGGRPVIYGLSTIYKEHNYKEGEPYQGRILSEECGIGIHEQYRYVSTMLHRRKGVTIDWTHEREWRWALPNDKTKVPGIPIFLDPFFADYFSEIIVIVSTDEELKETIDHLKNLYDAGGTNTGLGYNRGLIASTKVISLETISKLEEVDIHTMKIEDLPSIQMGVIPEFEVSEELSQKVKTAVEEAGRISIKATETYLIEHPEFDQEKGYYGWAHVCTTEISEVTEALLQLGFAHTFSDGVYYVNVCEYKTSNLDLLEIGADAAAKYLSKTLGQAFHVRWKLD